MTILANEIKNYKSAVITDTATNGGRMSGTNEITTALKNNLWSDEIGRAHV